MHRFLSSDALVVGEAGLGRQLCRPHLDEEV